MEQKIKNYCAWGVAFAIGWNVLIWVVYAILCLGDGVAFPENFEVEHWLGFYVCYALATMAWFYIGYALRKEFCGGKAGFVAALKGVDEPTADRCHFLIFI